MLQKNIVFDGDLPHHCVASLEAINFTYNILYYFHLLASSSDCEDSPLDIRVVIDRTKSIGKKKYDKMLDSVFSLIEKYAVGEDKTHFSIVTYASNPNVVVSLDDTESQSQEALQQAIDELKGKSLGSTTRTDKELNKVGEEVFVEENGDRSEATDIMIVFTDGNTAGNSEPYDTVLPTLKVIFIKELNSQSVIVRQPEEPPRETPYSIVSMVAWFAGANVTSDDKVAQRGRAQPGRAASPWLTHCRPILWSIDSFQNKWSADQYYITILRA